MPPVSTAPTAIVPPASVKSLDDLKALHVNHKRLVLDATKDEDTCTEWLATWGLIANERTCSTCPDRVMRLHVDNSKGDGRVWRCPQCRSRVACRSQSFFEGSHLSLSQILEFTYFWCLNVPHHVIRKELELGDGKHTIVDWSNFLRDVCAEFLADQNGQIGGVGRVVEVDESLFFRRKHNVGRVREQSWVLGGVERDGTGAFMEVVEDRKAATLMEVIQRRIAPGSTVHTDGWPAYGSLQQHGFVHHVVNHSENFVDPNDPDVHTQKVEGFWSQAKKTYRAMNGTSEALFETYIPEYLARRSVHTDAFFATILAAIRSKYAFA